MPLCLTFREGESFHIGENVKITFIRYKRGNIRLSIEAPRNVKIMRTTLIEREKKEPDKEVPKERK